MAGDFNRRRFLKHSALYCAGLATGLPTGLVGGGCSWRTATTGSADPSQARTFTSPDLVVATGEDPARNCRAALEALGGMHRFVRPGDRVVIKPNPVGNSRPEQAIHTHPDMITCVIRECLRVGAAEVVVTSHDSHRDMVANGTVAAVESAGGRLEVLERIEQFREVPVPRGRLLGREHIAASLVEADVFINMPIAKHHAGAEVTFAMKNLMGINWDRIRFHRTDLHRAIAELAGAVPHSLVILDANHVLLSNGPVGPGEVLRARTVVAGIDPVAVDTFALRYFDRRPEDIGHIRMARELGVGQIDLAKLRIHECTA